LLSSDVAIWAITVCCGTSEVARREDITSAAIAAAAAKDDFNTTDFLFVLFEEEVINLIAMCVY
jgi:hypothetical protein